MCSKSILTLTAVSVLLWLPAAMGAAPNCGCDFTPVQTELIRGGDEVHHMSVDVTGLEDLYLVVTFGGDNHRSDQAIYQTPIDTGRYQTTVSGSASTIQPPMVVPVFAPPYTSLLGSDRMSPCKARTR